MILLIIGLSLLFISIGLIITTKNAKYLLSGYNTMSESERAHFDIDKFIPFFRKFHVWLGVSFLLIGLTLFYIFGSVATMLFMVIYPLQGYLYFMWMTNKITKGVQKRGLTIGASILFLVLIGVLVLFYFGAQPSGIKITEAGIEIGGMYGEIIEYEQIKGVQLTYNIPPIKYKSNGFAIAPIYKGYFKTESGERLKLILNSNAKPLVFIELKNGSKVYYSGRNNIETFKKVEVALAENQRL